MPLVSISLHRIFLWALFGALSVSALTVHPRAGSTAFSDLLSTSFDARSYALGDASVALPGDLQTIPSNPAALGFMTKPSVAFGYVPILADLKGTFGSFGVPLALLKKETKGVSALTIHYLSFGTLDGVDENNLPTGETWGQSSLRGSATYGIIVSQGFAIGASVNALYGRISNESSVTSAKALTIDGGAQYRTSDTRFIAGLSLLNAGFLLSDYYAAGLKPSLPLTATIGLSVVPGFSPNLRFAADLVKSSDAYLQIRTGLEISIADQLIALRIGLNFDTQDIAEGLNNLSGSPNESYAKSNYSLVTPGLGVKTSINNHPLRLDAALQTRVAGFDPGFLLSASIGL